MLIQLLGVYIVRMWVILATLRNYMFPPSSGSKYIGGRYYVYMGVSLERITGQ
jgi:hypothetical protein